MRKNRKDKKILLIMLVVAILSMTIVYAAISTTLKIKGAGLVSTDGWSIKFENLEGVKLKGAAEEVTAPIIKSDTEIGDYSVVLKRPGDEVVYNFDIHNYGKLNAKIEEINIQTPVCTGNATDEAQKITDAQIVNESINYILTYRDGTEVKIGDVLNAEEIKNLTLKLSYVGENMPSESVQITGLGVVIKYVQDMPKVEEPIDPSKPVEVVDPSEIAGKKYDKETKIILNDTLVTIPVGATISGRVGEYESVDNGLVMYRIPDGEEVTDWNEDTNSNGIIDVQEKYDQFVWVPVENAVLDLSGNEEALATDSSIKAAVKAEIYEGRYPMAIKKNETDYFGVLYGFSLDADKNVVKMSFNTQWTPLHDQSESNGGNLEPDLKYEIGGNTNGTQAKYGITKDLLQSEYNNMVKNVEEKKGFWVGRYETSNFDINKENNNTNQVKIVKGATNGEKLMSDGTWYNYYFQQRTYSNVVSMSNTTSYMIWGSQWDQIMIWMRKVENKSQNSYYVLDALKMGNYGQNGIDDGYPDTSNPAPTGCFDVKNIYDLAGNVSELTCEVRHNRWISRRRIF